MSDMRLSCRRRLQKTWLASVYWLQSTSTSRQDYSFISERFVPTEPRLLIPSSTVQYDKTDAYRTNQ